jgi:hypothetical protein
VAEIVERHLNPTPDSIVYIAGHHDAPGRTFTFQSSGNLNAIPVEVVTIDDQVTKMQADSKHDAGVLSLIAIRFGYGLLEFNRRCERVDGAAKFGERTIPG